MRGHLLEAESAAAGAVKEASQLRQQLRSAQSRNQNQPADAAVLSRQTSSVFDQVMKETYEALKDEFQSNVVYKVRKCLGRTNKRHRNFSEYYQMLHTTDRPHALQLLPVWLVQLSSCNPKVA